MSVDRGLERWLEWNRVSSLAEAFERAHYIKALHTGARVAWFCPNPEKVMDQGGEAAKGCRPTAEADTNPGDHLSWR